MTEVHARRESHLDASVEQLVSYHELPSAFERLSPPWRSVRLVDRTGGLEPGSGTVFKGRFGIIPFTWVAEHVEHDGIGFTDVMRRGPFASWRHRHNFIPRDSGSGLVDDIRAKLPFSSLVPGMVRSQVQRDIEAMLRYRHLVTQDDLTDPVMAPMRIAITGASGLIGQRLTYRLRSRGHQTTELVRSAPSLNEILWNPLGEWDASPLEGFDAVIHLAGKSIGAKLRWDPASRRQIMESRSTGTHSLARGLATLKQPPRVLISSSAVGYYGNRGEEPLTEDSASGEGFLAEVVRAWEQAAEPARDAGIRVVHPRTGVALAAANGAVKPLYLLGSLGLLGPIGSGKQRFPWISLHDATRAMEHLIGSQLEGPVNLCLPEPPTQGQLAKVLAKLLRRPSFLPAPAFAIKALLGQQGEELLLSGQRIVKSKLVDDGFRFSLPDLSDALAAELGIYRGSSR